MADNTKIQVEITGKDNASEPLKKVADAMEKISSKSTSASQGLKDIGNSAAQAAGGFDTMTVGGYAVGTIIGNVVTKACEKAAEAIKHIAEESVVAGAEWAEGVNNIANKTGMAAQQASALAGVAKTVGLSGEEVGQALSVMSKNAADAAQSINDAAAAGKVSDDVFTKYGITILDENGNLLSSEKILANVTAKHREMANGVQKTAMEMDIMGRSGTKMNQLLNLSDEKINQYTASLQAAGLMMSGDMAEAFEETSQKGNLVDEVFKGMYVQINEALLPAIGAFYDLELDLAKAIGNTTDASSAFSNALSVIGSTAKTAVDCLRDLVTMCSNVATAFSNIDTAITNATSSLAKYIGMKGSNGDEGYFDPYGMGKTGDYINAAKKEEQYQKEEDANDSSWNAYVAKAEKSQNATNKLGDAIAKAGNSASRAAASAGNLNKATENNIAGAMRSLENVMPYYLDASHTATGCMYAVSTALKSVNVSGKLFANNLATAAGGGTYMASGATNVEAFARNAAQYGLLRAASSGYQGKAGDVVIFSRGGAENFAATTHAGVISEQGTVIQNGQSHGTVYQSNLTPQQQGGVAYYVDMSAYSNQTTAGSSAINAREAMNNAINAKAQAEASYKSALSGINNQIGSITGTPESIKILDEAKTKVAALAQEIATAKANGIDTKELEKASTDYFNAMKTKSVQAKQEETDKRYQLEIEHIGKMVDLGQGYTADMNNEMAVELSDYKQFLQNELDEGNLTAQQRAQVESNLADTVKQQNEIAAQDMTQAWDVALTEMANRQLNYSESITNVFDGIEQAGVNLMSSTASIGDRMAAFFDDITSSILSNMAKIIMQGLVTHAVMALLGMGNSGDFASEDLFTNDFPSWDEFTAGMPHYASGGSFSPGYAMVGENGPEVVRFGTSGRVYNNTESNNLLAGGNKNITVSIHNETGTAAQVDSARTTFDPESYVLNVVLKGVANNTNGMRTVFQGLATQGA